MQYCGQLLLVSAHARINGQYVVSVWTQSKPHHGTRLTANIPINPVRCKSCILGNSLLKTSIAVAVTVMQEREQGKTPPTQTRSSLSVLWTQV